MFMHVWLSTYMHVYIHRYIHPCLPTYIYIYMHRTYMDSGTHKFVDKCINDSCMSIYTDTHACS